MPSNGLQNILMAIFIAIIVYVLALIPYTWGWHNGYKEGQIDALNGAIYYKLEKQPDSEFRWIKCAGICRYGKAEEEK